MEYIIEYLSANKNSIISAIIIPTLSTIALGLGGYFRKGIFAIILHVWLRGRRIYKKIRRFRFSQSLPSHTLEYIRLKRRLRELDHYNQKKREQNEELEKNIMHKKDAEGNLPEEDFYNFLNLITAFIWAYAITNPGVNSLRTPVYAEMVNIVNNAPVKFRSKSFEENQFRSMFSNYKFSNARPITKSLLTWWAFTFSEQEMLDTSLDIEHIYSRSRYKKEKGLSKLQLESLGNKSLLERNINISASDYRFEDKIGYYKGTVAGKGERKATRIRELQLLADRQTDFTGEDIANRTELMLDSFVEYLRSNDLLQNNLLNL